MCCLTAFQFQRKEGHPLTVSLSHDSRNQYRGAEEDGWFVNTYPTDVTGRFVCDALPVARVFDLYLEHAEASYRQLRRVWFPEGVETLDLGVVLSDGPRTLKGRVVDATGRGILGVRVMVGDFRRDPGLLVFGYPASPLRGSIVQTDAAGRFVCRGLSPGFHRLVARRPGFAPRVISELEILETGDATIVISLEVAHTLKGMVVDANEAPVDGATVRLMRKETARLGETSYLSLRNVGQRRSRTDGSFEFDDVSIRGLYVLEAVLGECRSEQLSWIHSTPPPRLRLEGDAGSGSGSCAVRGHLEAHIGALFATNSALRHARVTLRSVEGYDHCVAPDKHGDFAMKGVRPGKYELRAEVPGFLMHTMAIELDAGRDSDRDMGPIVLQRGTTLTGRITDAASGRPIADATVHYLGHHTVRSNAVGVYTISGLPEREHKRVAELQVGAAGYQSQRLPYRPNGAGAEIVKHLALHRTAGAPALRARVVDREGQALAGVEVGINHFLYGVRGRMTRRVTRTALDGSFHFRGLPHDVLRGECTLDLHHPGYTPRVVVLTSDTETPGSITMERARAVHGQVVDHNGQPVPFARVGSFQPGPGDDRLPKVDHRPMQTTICDDQGRFTFKHLSVADRFLLPSAPGHRVPPDVDPNKLLAASSCIGRHLCLVLQRGKEISGRIVDHTGRPLNETASR